MPVREEFQQAVAAAPPPRQTGSRPVQSKQKRATPPPFSLRLTFEERAALERLAGDMPLGCYIRSRILGDGEARPRRKRRAPVENQEALGKVLAKLGDSRLANNLNQLARAVNTGSLPVTPDTEKAILDACADVRHMRMELLRALGIMTEAGP